MNVESIRAAARTGSLQVLRAKLYEVADAIELLEAQKESLKKMIRLHEKAASEKAEGNEFPAR